jgi:hypothetical protein
MVAEGPFFRGRPGWVRSSAWIWLFSSTLRRIDIKPDHVMQLVDEVGIIRELELPNTMRLQPCARQMRCTELALIPAAFAIMVAVQ